MTLTAAADGSALGNPGPAGWAWYIDENTWRAGGWPHGTNNMGELKAVLDLLEATAADADQHLTVLCDSQYVINAVTTWMPGWKRKGWRKKDGKPVLNVELLQAIDRALAGRSVEFEWVKGHSGHAMNEAADQRANDAATAFSKGQDPQVGPGYREAEAPASARPATAGPGATDEGARPAPADGAGDLFSLFDADPSSASADVPDQQGGTDEPGAPYEQITSREQALLSDGLRSAPDRAADLLHPSFTEIGASGRTYDRDQILAHLAPLDGIRAEEFLADEIAPGVVLLRYCTTGRDGTALRTSVWVREGETWLLRHHQGTPVGRR